MKTIRINKEAFKKHYDDAVKNNQSSFHYLSVPFSVEYAKILLEVMENHTPKSLSISYQEKLWEPMNRN